MNINLIILLVLEYILTLAGTYLFLHVEDFKYKFLGFLLVLIGLGIACVTLYISTTQMIVCDSHGITKWLYIDYLLLK